MSLQAAIWNRNLLLSVLQPSKTAWEVEIYTSPPEEMHVLGTRQCPVRYANAILKGQVQESEVNRIPEEHRSRILTMIPRDWSVSVP
jgi:hypothetical protein